MATVITWHTVKNYEEWRPHFDADAERRNSAGIVNETVYQQSGDPNNVTIIWEMDNPSILETMMSDPALKEKMEAAGVLSKPEYVVLNKT